MIDYSLKECPFCGNPAEIVESEPFSFSPNTTTEMIRCSNEWCVCRIINVRFQPDIEISVQSARQRWNTRHRKNKITWSDADNLKSIIEEE